jgi:hypothetical protein
MNGTQNATIASPQINTTRTFHANASDGVYNATIYCADTAVDMLGENNVGSAVSIFTVDTVAPSISYLTPSTPTNGSHARTDSLAINLSVSELNLANKLDQLHRP